MPPVIIAAIAVYAGAIGVASFILITVSYAYGQYAASRARRKARDAYNASLRDRLVTTSTVDGYRSRCYGRVRNVDGVLFKATRGDKSQYYTLVVALAGHECDGIETVYFNDQPLSLDANGWVLTAPWSGVVEATGGRLFFGQGTVNLTGGSGSTTLANTPVASSVTVTSGDSIAPPANVSVVGNVVTVSGWTAPDGPATVNYQWNLTPGAASAKARVRKFLGAPGQDLSSVLQPLFPTLITAGVHRFEGICCLLVDLEYDQDAYPTGVPQISAVIRGAKILDPRTSITAWSENPALIARDWALYAQGGGAQADELVASSFTTAANACDVSHTFTSTNASGVAVSTTRPMFTCGIVCRTEANPADTMDAIVESMAGKWAWTGGQLRVRAGSYSAPVATLTESWCSGQGDIELVSNPARGDLVNVYTPTIADAAQSYVPLPIPRVAASAYIDADGGELPRDITLEGVTDADHAQHVCGILLRDQRQGLTGSIPCNLSAYPVEVFDTIALDLPRFGFSGKTVEVLGWQFSQRGGVVLSWKETDASIFDPDAGFTRSDPAPNTKLASPYHVPTVVLNAPTSGTAELLRQKDGSIVSRIKVSWAAVQDAGVINGGAIEIRYGLGGTAPELWQVISVPGADTQTYIDGVQDGGIYIIAARARNRLVAGDWSVPKVHKVVGKTAAPAAVSGLAATVVPGALRITRTPSTELDYASTIYRYGASFAAGTQVPGTADERGCLWAWPAPGTYTIWAADVDSTGNVGPAVGIGPISITQAALAPANASLSIKLNANDFAGTVNYNEAYLHGRDSAGNPADVPGTILINGVATPVPNGRLVSDKGPIAGYIVWDSAGATFTTGPGPQPYVLARRYQGQWQYDNNSAGGDGWTTFTPGPTHWIIGTLESGAPDTNSPPGLIAASIWAAASTLNSLEAGADAAYAGAIAAIPRGTMNADPALMDSASTWEWSSGVSVSSVPSVAPGALGVRYFACATPSDRFAWTKQTYPISSARSYNLSALLYAGAGNDRNMYLVVDMYKADGTRLTGADTGWGGTFAGYTFGGLPTPDQFTRYGNSVDFGAGSSRPIPASAAYFRVGVWFQYGSGTTSINQAAEDIRLVDVTEARVASVAAATAQGDASSALNTLATMRSNGYIDAAEKPALIKQWQTINDEYLGIYNQGSAYGLGALRNSYEITYYALQTYLTGLSPSWSDTTVDTPITPAVDQAKWAAYYSARQTLLNAIADETAKRAQWAQVSGTGKPSDNATADVVLIADGPMTITGNTAQKTGGGGGWNASVRSRDSFNGGAYVSWVHPDPSYSFGLGLNEDPAANASYDTVTAWLYNAGTSLYVYNNGTVQNGGSPVGTVAAGDVLAVTFDGTNLRYLCNGNVLFAQPWGIGVNTPVFLDSSFDTVGGMAKNIKFGPMTSNAWSSIGGSGKPADNATRNYTYRQSGDPAVSPGGVVDGELWLDTGTGKAWQRVSGAWQPYVGNSSVDTPQLAGQAATVTYETGADTRRKFGLLNSPELETTYSGNEDVISGIGPFESGTRVSIYYTGVLELYNYSDSFAQSAVIVFTLDYGSGPNSLPAQQAFVPKGNGTTEKRTCSFTQSFVWPSGETRALQIRVGLSGSGLMTGWVTNSAMRVEGIKR